MRNRYGSADLIVANNVFAHIPDIRGVTAVSAFAEPRRRVVFEVHYLGTIGPGSTV